MILVAVIRKNDLFFILCYNSDDFSDLFLATVGWASNLEVKCQMLVWIVQ